MKKTQIEILNSKLKWNKLYCFLMFFFLIGAIVSATFAIIKTVEFKNYKNTLDHSEWISVVIQTKLIDQEQEIETPAEYQLNPNDYGGSKVDGDRKGETLDHFLRSFPNIFHFAKDGRIDGIKGSEKNSNLINNYWWCLYSPTDPSSIQYPDQPSAGAPFMILQNANVFYFALHAINKK